MQINILIIMIDPLINDIKDSPQVTLHWHCLINDSNTLMQWYLLCCYVIKLFDMKQGAAKNRQAPISFCILIKRILYRFS